jgi:hypothetical protein
MSNPAATQSDAVYSGLSSYYKAVSDALQNGTEVPSVGSIVGSLSFTDLETMASLHSKGTPSYAVGSAVETAHLAASIIREYVIRVKTKAEYYSDGISSHSTESDYFDKLKYMHGSAIAGGSINGSLTQ